MLREIRKVESEEASCSRPVPKQKAQQKSGQAEKADSKEDAILGKLTELMSKMTSMERELERQKQAIASVSNQSLSHEQSYQNKQGYKGYNRGGYGRGGYGHSGYGRGCYGRGYQGNQNENSRGGKGGRSRGVLRSGCTDRPGGVTFRFRD